MSSLSLVKHVLLSSLPSAFLGTSLCFIFGHGAFSLLVAFPSIIRIKLIRLLLIFLLSTLNSGKKTSHSLENFSIAVLVGSTLQVRDTGLGIVFERITPSVSVWDTVQWWLQRTTSVVLLAAHVFKSSTGFLLRSLIYQDSSL